jgi:ATP-binding cassette subfamily F protein uup
MSLLTFTNVSLAYGHHPLLDKVEFRVEAGERVCLVGRNGSGKSTLLRVASGAAQADEGEVWRQETLRISHLEQEVIADRAETLYEVVAAGLGEIGRLLAEYHRTAQQAAETGAASLANLALLHNRIDTLHGWNIEQKVAMVLSRLSLPADQALAACSGGMRRRVMLARALVSEPELLLLDEPTNHLDIAAISWLEEFLLSFPGAILFVSHDRSFSMRVATRIVELDRGSLTSFPGDYAYYLRKKDELLEIEERANAKFDKNLAQHEAWIRQGIKARRTRNEGRVRVLEAMRRARSQRITAPGSVSLAADLGDLSGKLVADLRQVGFRYADRWVVQDFSTRILRGDRVGIMGPNGCGKTTLLKLIVGELAPSCGQVVLGTRLQAGYFDQQRSRLDPAKTVRQNIAEGSDYILVRGRSRHVVGYLRSFLFPRERIDSPVAVLSGGECNRLLLAQLLAQPANLLVLDEPTNDLDVDTLELLEGLLAEYEGTLLLVSHDRTFLDNVVTSTIVFGSDGRLQEYVGGYTDWQRQRGPRLATERATAEIEKKSKAPTRTAPARGADKEPRRRLGYKDKQELQGLPTRIETLEAELSDLEAEVTQSEFYQQEKAAITAVLNHIEQARRELERAYERWEYLDSMDAKGLGPS